MVRRPLKILVTGGAGYIGSVLVPELLKGGHEVTVIDNFMYGQSSLLDICYHENLQIIRGDVRNREFIEKSIKGVDVIFPLACLTGAPLCKKFPEEAKAIIGDALKVMLAAMNEKQRVIYPTTNSGYGIGQEGIFCTEESPLNPVSLYGKLKMNAEKILLDSGKAVTLRLATVFGISPRMRLDLLVNDFTYRAVNDRFIVLFQADFKRNYIHVRDVVRAFFHCLDNFESMRGQTFNWGLSDANLSKRELCEEIKKQIPDFCFVESPIGKDPDKRNYIVSNEKIERTGLTAKFSVQDGIRELIKGYEIIKRDQFTNV